MKTQKYNTSQLYGLMHTDIDGIDSLIELALNIRWSWNHASDEIWQRLDSELWEFTRNPWVILQTVSRNRLEEHLADSTFREKLDGLLKANEQAISTPSWFQQNHPNTALTTIAYFCRWPGQCSGRSTKSGQRSGRTCRCRGTALCQRLLPTGNRQIWYAKCIVPL